MTNFQPLEQGLARRMPPVANSHLNYCFLHYSKTQCRWISHRLHTGRHRTDIWSAKGYLVPTVINNHKIFFVNSLKIFTTCRILRLFPSVSKCEIMTFLFKLLHWTTMCRFPDLKFVPPPPS